MKSIKENLSDIKQNINSFEAEANRPKDSVKLLAVSKFHTKEEIEEAIKAGQKYFGENRVQEAYEKFSELYKNYPDIELHIIGQLQTNKVKKACEIASFIESVDRIDLIKEIEKRCSQLNKTIRIFYEVHTGEKSKSGFTSENELKEAIRYTMDGNTPHIIPCGLMTMAPFTDNTDLIHASFKKLVQLKIELNKEYPELNLEELSMGMSGDYRIAIEEGSTEVRIGTAIFGERDYSKK
ncbi:MAG: YggS family pyridoxal phosphate-dependent enzyme [Treponema sp.]|nr:YggS family pyridoxal phosphate-dependent enzyme [Treponema sp.]